MTAQLVRSACDILFSSGQTVEVRMLGKRGAASGFFDDHDRRTAAVLPLENRGEYGGIYVSLNPVNPDLLARRANRIETRLGKDEKSAGDSDILCRHWLPVDIDPIRPSGVSSSDEEHANALAKADHIATYLANLGWPRPVVADSGNGAHLLYRINLPNDDPSRDLMKEVLKTLDNLFTDEQAAVDTSVFNAARIWKLYGTTSRKGDNIASRPHRKAAILSAPEEPGVVTADQLIHLAGLLPREQPVVSGKDRKMGESLDLATWFSRYEVGNRQKPYNGGTLFVLDECPFSSDHTDGAYAIQFPNGAIFAGCHHASCGGGAQRWPALREKYEGSIPERLRKLRARQPQDTPGNRTTDRSLKPAHSSVIAERDAIVSEIASSMLKDGNPLRYMMDTFALDHIGDPVVAECLVMSLASRQVINAKGLHVSVTGESGKGKSHTFETMMLQVPEELRLEGRMSDKALFYIRDMKPGTVIILDDVSLSDQMQEILKGVTTSFRRPFKYRTVNKDRAGETCTIPERCVWWVAKVDGTGDDQVWNRMLTCWIDDSEDQDARVLSRMLSEAAHVQKENPGIRQEILVCQEIWRSLDPVWVVVPFAEQIRFASNMNRRNPDMLLDLVRAHAAMMQHQRERVEGGDMHQILATREDFLQASRLYLELNGKSGSQQSKLTRKESELVEAIRSRGQGEVTIAELQDATGKSHSVIYKMIHGSTSKGNHYSGLLEKCPAISVCDRTLIRDESSTSSAHRRTKAYSWNPYVFDAWNSDEGCWLDEDPDGHGGFADGGGNIAEFSATNPDQNYRSDQEYLSNNNSFSTYCGNDENIQGAITPQAFVCPSLSDGNFSATHDQDDLSEGNGSSDGETGAFGCSGTFRNLSANSVGIPQQPLVSATGVTGQSDQISQGQIRTGDFTGTSQGIGPGPCDCCGYPWVHYQERMTRERLSRPPRMNRKICRKCYDVAREAEATSIRPLPGLISIPAMIRLDKDLGRCQVCDGQKAMWHDPEGKVAICEGCYRRELKQRRD